MAPLPRILLVDDEEDLTEALGAYLSARGYEVRAVASGAALRATAPEFLPDVVVLDLHLGRESGVDLTQWLLDRLPPPRTPAILLLSGAATPLDRVLGLEMGGDDFLEKPVMPRELLARIAGLLRRAGKGPERRGIVTFGDLALDIAAQTLVGPDGTESRLLPSEFALLKCFLDEPTRVFSRDELLDRAPASAEETGSRAVDSRIQRLRHKLEGEGGAPVIETVRGLGYRLAAGVVIHR